jgi:hypothetical protein
MDEERLEHDTDVFRLAEPALDTRAPSLRPDEDEIARPEVACTLAVDLDGNVRNEERLADEPLAAPVEFDD